jgi:adenosylcobinamide-GDP ribazoletransferase
VSFLTVVPVRAIRIPPDASFGRAVSYFPLVGALLGAFVAGVDSVCGQVLPRPVVTVLDLALVGVLTGGLHLDGLIDACDGLLGGHDRERRLEIMRDSRAGSFGVICAALVLLLDFAALGGMYGRQRAAALIVAPTLGRWAMAVAVWAFPYARSAGRGTVFKLGLRPYHILQAGCWTALIASVVGYSLFWPVCLGILLATGLGRWAAARLGGLTGDVYGAICELTTAAAFVLCAARF